MNVESLEDGKRMPVISQEQIPAGNVVNEFLDLRYHENELDNYYKQGRRWFGESVSGVDGKTKTFDFVFRDVIADSTNFARFNLVGSSLNERFYARIKINDKVVFDSLRINQRVDHVFGYEVDVFGDFTLDSDTLSVTLDVLSQSDASTVYVDFLLLMYGGVFVIMANLYCFLFMQDNSPMLSLLFLLMMLMAI